MSNLFRNLILFVLFYLCVGMETFAFEGGQIVSLTRGKFSLMVENSSFDTNKNAVLWTETNTHSQRWMLVDTGKGTYYLQNVYTQLYLGGISAATNNAVVGQVTKTIANSRGTWELVPVEGSEDKYNLYIGSARKYALSSNADIADGTGVSLLLASSADPSLLEWTIAVDEDIQPYGFSKNMRDDMMVKFKARHYKQQSTGFSIDNGGWWGDAEMFETIIDAYETTGNQDYATMFENLYNNFIARNKSTWYKSGVSGYNEYNDDIAWMCIACTRAYLLTGTTKYLTTAKSNFDGMFERADCYGNDLLQWKHNSGQGTNACINGPAAVCACYLAIATADMSYYEKAKKTYLANRNLLYEFSNGNPTGKVWDSYNQGTKEYNYWASTYNQGTSLGAALMLYDYYNDPMFKTDADAIIKWTVNNLADGNGIIKVCQTVKGDLCGFKGILMRYIRRYAEDLNHPEYYTWMAKNAYHAWNNRNSSGITSSAWLYKSEENFKHQEGDELKTFEAFGNSTCLSAAFNAHLGVVDQHNAYEPIQAEDFNFIKSANVVDKGNTDDNTGMVSNMRNNQSVGYRHVNFGSKYATHITLRAHLLRSTSRLKVYVDAPDTKNGTLLCTVSRADADNGANTWCTYTKALTIPVIGDRNIYLVASGTSNVDLLSLNWFQFQSNLSIYGDMTNKEGELTSSLNITDDKLHTIIDDDILTGFTASVSDAANVYLQYHSPMPIQLQGYSICSGLESNDPVSWTLQASNDGTHWDVLHEQTDTTFAVRAQQMCYDVESSMPYIYYKLSLVLPEGVNKLSLSEWQLLGRAISLADITGDGGKITEGLEALIDHLGETATITPITAVYKSEGNYSITSYAITCANGPAPTAWTLEGSVNGSTWKLIDQQTDIRFPYPGSTYICNVVDVPSYQYFRLKIQGEDSEVAQWQLFGNYNYGNFYADVTSFSKVYSNIGEEANALVDNNGETCSTVHGSLLQWSIKSPVPVRVVGYSLLCGDDSTLDPSNISLLGVDENGNTTQISNRYVTFNARAGRVTATVSTSLTYNKFLLVVNETTSGVNIARLAEFELFGTAISEADNNLLLSPVTIEASSEGVSTSESKEKLSDQNRTSRYRTDFIEPVSITYTFENPVSVHYYSITAAKDAAANDPKDWVLEASNDGNNWELLDMHQGESFSNRYATQFYKLSDEPIAYNLYRLTLNAVNGGTQLHIGEFQLMDLSKWYQDEEIANPIFSVVERESSSDTRIFNMAGQLVGSSLDQKLDRLPKGIYVVGGKKIQKK